MLTKGERFVLERMVKDEELVQSIPGGWWLDDCQISGRVGWSLLRKVLISEVEVENDNYRRYHINEWGRNALLPNTVCTPTDCGLSVSDSLSTPAAISG